MPLARGKVVAANRQPALAAKSLQPAVDSLPACASLQPLRRKRPRFLMKRRELAKQRGGVATLCSSRRRINLRMSSALVVFARSSASLFTRPAGVQIETLNPKRFVFGRYWGGLKQPPRRAAPRPSGSRRAASEGRRAEAAASTHPNTTQRQIF